MCNKIRHSTIDGAQAHRRRLMCLGSKTLHIYKCEEGCLVNNRKAYHVGHPRGKAITKSRKRKRGVW